MACGGRRIHKSLFKPPKYPDFLPFLYCTRTILRPVNHNRVYTIVKVPTREITSSASYSLLRSEQHIQNDIPFEDHQHLSSETSIFGGSQKGSQSSSDHRSTLTISEKAIFDRILNDDSVPTRQEPIEEYSLDHARITPEDPYEDLDAIFDAAIRELTLREEQRAKSLSRSRAIYAVMPVRTALQDLGVSDEPNYVTLSEGGEVRKGFSRPLQFTDGKLTQAPIGDAEESDEKLRIACDEHRHFIRDMLEKTSTDVETWTVLQSEVFSMVEQLRLQMEHEEKVLKQSKKRPKKDPKASLKAKAKTRDGKSKDFSLDSSSEAKTLQSSASSQVFSPLFNESKALPTNTLLAILQANYSYYNVLALRLWRRCHPTTLYALHLLPHIKSLGPISYVLGASASLYNEVLYVKWSQYNDLHGVAALLQEMINQGVEPNALTLEFLRYVSRTRQRDLAGRRGKVLRSWWYLRSVKEDWAKVKAVYGELKRRLDAVEAEEGGREQEEERPLVGKMQDAMDEEEEGRERREFRIQRPLYDPAESERILGRTQLTKRGFRRMRYGQGG